MKTSWPERRLQRLFNHYNRRFWAARLSQYTIEVVSGGYLSRCLRRERRIHINLDKLRTDESVGTILLHEMVHAALPRGGHGEKFKAELRRLISLG